MARRRTAPHGRGDERAGVDRANRPDVVSVHGGTIRTGKAGVATVTATLTCPGVSASTLFVVDAQ